MVALTGVVVLLWTFFVYYMTKRGMINDIYEQSRGRGRDSLYRHNGRGVKGRRFNTRQGHVGIGGGDGFEPPVERGFDYNAEDGENSVGEEHGNGRRGRGKRKNRKARLRRRTRDEAEGAGEGEEEGEGGGEGQGEGEREGEGEGEGENQGAEETEVATETSFGGELAIEEGEEVEEDEPETVYGGEEIEGEAVLEDIKQQQLEETGDASGEDKMGDDDDENLHIIFSTECNQYQDWQSLLVFYSAWSVSQKGHITRIVSGCDEAKQESLKQLYADMYPNNFVHFVPDYRLAEEYKLIDKVRAEDPDAESEYRFFNKPYSVKHWLENMENPVENGTIIALIDPDMIFLRPLTTRVKGENVLHMQAYVDNGLDQEPPERVQQGQPAAQLYGLGSSWTVAPKDFVDDYGNTKKGNFNRTDICGPQSPCNFITSEEVDMHYAVGPPYIIEVSDLTRLTDVWLDFLPRVYAGYPELLAEMFVISHLLSLFPFKKSYPSLHLPPSPNFCFLLFSHCPGTPTQWPRLIKSFLIILYSITWFLTQMLRRRDGRG